VRLGPWQPHLPHPMLWALDLGGRACK
jgi:hypothetical protein